MNTGNPQYNQGNMASPPPDLRVERLARELETNWNQFIETKKAAEILAQRPAIQPKAIEVLNQTAAKQFEENVARAVHEFMNSTASANGSAQPGPGPQPNPGGFSYSSPYMGKKLSRVEYDKMLAGVCGGLAEYFRMDSSIIRVLFVIGTVWYGVGLIAYVVLAILLPIKMTPDEA